MTFKYRFVPVWPAVFSDLREGVEATVHRADGSAVEPWSTVQLNPGDFVESTNPITGGGDDTATHPFLVPVDSIPDPTPVPVAVVAAVVAPTATPPAPPAPTPTAPLVSPAPSPTASTAPPADTQEN